MNKETVEMENNINALNEAIRLKEAPMQVSQTRLDTRSYRPNVELCRDRVQYKLIDEVCYLTNFHGFDAGFSRKFERS